MTTESTERRRRAPGAWSWIALCALACAGCGEDHADPCAGVDCS